MTDDLCKAGIMIEEMSKKTSEKTGNNDVRQDGAPIMEHVVAANLPTKYGNFRIHGYVNRLNGEHHVALTMGDVGDGKPVLVRVHSECLTGDVFGSAKCDCGDQFDAAMRMIAAEGRRCAEDPPYPPCGRRVRKRRLPWLPEETYAPVF